jgi:hypothetical protein
MKPKKLIVKVKEEDDIFTEIEVDDQLVDFYKKETHRSIVTLKGISKFINRLVFLHLY